MRHVVLYIPDFNAGGAERVAINLAEALPSADTRCTLLVNREWGPLRAVVPPGVRLVSLKASRTLSALPALIRFIRRERPDVIISSLSFNNILAIWANLLAGRPSKVVISLHNTLSKEVDRDRESFKHGLVPKLYDLSLPLADHVVTVSRGVAKDLQQFLPTKLGLSVIYNPIVSPLLLDLAKAPLDHEWFLPGQPPLILGVGRLVAQKNFALLIDAFAILAETHPFRLAILGEGPLREGLQRRIDDLRIADRVVLLRADPNPWRYMARASVMVMSSLYEGFGNVLVEAMAVGTPVVSTDCPHGPAEILEGGRYGTLVDGYAPADMALAIETALARHDDTAEITNRAMAFSSEAIAMQYRNLARQLTGKGKSHFLVEVPAAVDAAPSTATGSQADRYEDCRRT